MGATIALDARTRKIADAQKELGMVEGFDVGLEMSGNAAAFRELLSNMCHGGKVAMLGIPSEEMAIDWNTVVFNMLTIQGIYGREMYRPRDHSPVAPLGVQKGFRGDADGTLRQGDPGLERCCVRHRLTCIG
jgi:threonine dehydrogenase-like Zn-dependent dehydrogenase